MPEDVSKLKTPGGTVGSTPKAPTSGVEKGAKSTTERVEKQKVNDGGEGERRSEGNDVDR